VDNGGMLQDIDKSIIIFCQEKSFPATENDLTAGRFP
jgi:hypothetical protein